MSSADELPKMDDMVSPLLGQNAVLRTMQEERPIWKVRTPAGDEGWLVIRAAEIKKLLVDRRLGRAHPDPRSAPKYVQSPIFETIMRRFRHHAEFRGLLTPHFSRANMRALQPTVLAIVDEMADGLIARNPPLDLQYEFSRPLSMRVLCALVGVPAIDSELVAGLLYQMGGIADEGGAAANTETFVGYLEKLASHKRTDPGTDVISGLAAAGQTDNEIANLVSLLLFAGHESVATQIGFGVARLATSPDLRDALIADPELIGTAVEELLRTSAFGGGAQPHYAVEDIEIAGVTIRAGDLVLPDFAVANYDSQMVDEPDRVDLTRSPNPHLAFAHGIWHCIGAPLARMQLQAAISTLLTRVPTLRLAASLDELNKGDGASFFSSMRELQVMW